MHAGHDERVVFVIVRKMDNTGGKRRTKMGKVKAFEEMLMKDVPGKAQKIMICMRVRLDSKKLSRDQLVCKLSFLNLNSSKSLGL